LVARTRASEGASCIPPCTCVVFGCPACTFCLHLFIRLPSSIPHASVFWISPSLMVQDDLIHPGYRDPCVRHPKKLMHACNQTQSRLVLDQQQRQPNTTTCTSSTQLLWSCIAWPSWLKAWSTTNHALNQMWHRSSSEPARIGSMPHELVPDLVLPQSKNAISGSDGGEHCQVKQKPNSRFIVLLPGQANNRR